MTTADSTSKESYGLLLEVSQCPDHQLSQAYYQLRQLLERLCLQQMEGVSLQLTDLSARITYLASKLNLSTAAQNRLHTFRLASNAILNEMVVPKREDLMRDAKTIAWLVRLITREDIPQKLKDLLPEADATFHALPPAVERVKRMRVSFLLKDEHYLYVQPADYIPDGPLKVRYGLVDVNEEFNDTVGVLWPHAQLNLLDVGIDEKGILTPMFIVLEPDYLIDVSTLAECFKNYGHHPANYLMSRLTPAENTRHLILGNIANAFLDEWIYNASPDYKESMMKAFREHPISISACRELQQPEVEKQFGKDARMHFDHIRQMVCHTFQEPGFQLDKTDAVLEPSYICEALGIQGRLDYMQRDMSSFIEMKSGKADEFTMPGRVLPQENNRVQMLLYQAMLEYSMGVDHRQGKAYLLYTRYPLLYPARPSWAMVRRVINLRNRIVATEYQVQAHDSEEYTAQVLAQINPLTLNENQLTNKLWRDYQEPDIMAFQQRLSRLTSLERSYFYTLYSFITRELYVSKTGGSSDYEGRKGQAMQWLSTFQEKAETGEIVADLRIMENHASDIKAPFLLLSLPTAPFESPSEQSEARVNSQWSIANFRKGDSIILYRRDDARANATNQLLFKGSVEDMLPGGVWKIALRQPQQNQKVLPADSLYAIEHDFMDTTSRSQFQALSLFLQATPQRRDLLLGQRAPEHDSDYEKNIEEAKDDFERITQKALAAQDYFLLVGPPGTGKTSMALRSMVDAFRQRGSQILLMSYTNRAVDEICKMLTKLGADYMRIGMPANCAEPYRDHLLQNCIAGCQNRRQVLAKIQDCQIMVGTVATLAMRTSLFSIKSFDVALIDEATQILEPQLLGLLCMRDVDGGDAIRKFVLIGDYKQLPAVVQQSSTASEVKNPQLRAIGLTNLKDSLFERLYRVNSEKGIMNNSLTDNVQWSFDMLTRQGRMHPQVARFANEAFYEGKLQPVGLPHQLEADTLAPSFDYVQSSMFNVQLTKRFAFFPSQPEPAMSSHKVNHDEAVIAVKLAHAVYVQSTDFDPQHTLGIITPYRSQIALIRQELLKLQIPALNDITIDTVERYQGSERDVIIYSFCVNRTWQLQQLSNLTEDNGHLIDRKLNVALTRARRQLFLIGVSQLLHQHPIYDRLLQYCIEDQVAFRAWLFKHSK
ncbi:MAG: AAA family ATPase [Bacteroidaceae bacterium]|nr:AAA family ATPase [Bacteroidaceae bacterium]